MAVLEHHPRGLIEIEPLAGPLAHAAAGEHENRLPDTLARLAGVERAGRPAAEAPRPRWERPKVVGTVSVVTADLECIVEELVIEFRRVRAEMPHRE